MMSLDQRQGRSASYPRGFGPQERRLAMQMQLHLLEHALAPWPRRQAPLLAVNCGNGAMLPFLWQCGFDVQATEEDAALRLKAQQRQLPGMEVYAARDTDLPFDNDSFDWVVIHLKSSDKKSIEKCHQEGARLARRGMMVTFWNSQALTAICWRIFHGRPWADNAISWWFVWRHMRSLGLGRVSTLTTLVMPAAIWRLLPRKEYTATPLGAWCAVRLDMGPSVPSTPLPLRLGGRFASQNAVLEPFQTRTEASDSLDLKKQADNK